MSLQDKQTIIVSGGGADYTRPLTIEDNNKRDISAVPIFMALGTSLTVPPSSWTSAVDTPQTKVYRRVVSYLVTASYAVGDYYLWVKVTNTPAVIIRPVARIFVR